MRNRTPAIRSFQTVSLLAAGLLIAWAVPVHAYVDPGSGSMLVQLVTAGAAGVLVLARLYWRRLKDKIRGRPTADDSTPPDDVTGTSPKDRT